MNKNQSKEILQPTSLQKFSEDLVDVESCDADSEEYINIVKIDKKLHEHNNECVDSQQ